MRDILFKAKRVDNGEWVKGNLIKTFTGISYIAKEFDHILSTLERYEVDPSTICQYTGLTDKNGRKIWENDIVTEMYRQYVGKIVYNDCGFEVHWVEADIRKDIIFFKAKRGIEVIGNVFDNPELLEGGN